MSENLPLNPYESIRDPDENEAENRVDRLQYRRKEIIGMIRIAADDLSQSPQDEGCQEEMRSALLRLEKIDESLQDAENAAVRARKDYCPE